MADNNSDWLDGGTLDDNNNWVTASKTDDSSSPNNGGSVWGSGLLTTINSLANTGASVYKTVNGTPKPAAKTTTQSFLPWIIGGLAVLILGALLLRRN